MQAKTPVRFSRLMLGIMFWSLLAFSASAQSFGSVTLGWNASSDPTVIGYTLYYGTSSGNYSNSLSAGNATTATVSNLSVGVYYFVVTATNSEMLESAPSSEVSATVSAPSVSLTAPQGGVQFSAPAKITLTAAASEAGGSIDHVDFLSGSTVIGTASASPYTVVWQPVPQGSYSLTAKAVDTLGGTTFSASANIIVNPNVSSFTGGFRGVGTTSNGGAMLVNVTMTKTGQFTGRVVDGIFAAVISGTFNQSGVADVTVRPPHTTPYPLVLSLDSNNNTIAINEPGNASAIPITLNQSPYTTKHPAAAGAFTMLLGQFASSQASVPTAPGFATVTIATSGAVRITGLLADTTPFSTGSQLMADGTYAVYALPYGGLNGYLAGQITMEETPGVSDGNGTLTWVKPTQPRHTPYSAGWEGTVVAQLSVFQKLATKPAKGAMISATVSGGDLPAGASPVEADLLLSPSSPGLIAGRSAPLQLSLQQNTGLFSGSFRFTPQSEARSVRGIVFQKTATGSGYFVAPQAVGDVVLTNAPSPAAL